MFRQPPQTTCSKMLCELPFANLSAGSKTLLENSGEAKKIGSVLRLKLGGRHLLLGENGCGKTTLLHAIHYRQIPGWPESASTCLVEQSLLCTNASGAETGESCASSTSHVTALEFILRADVTHNDQLARIARLEAALGAKCLSPESAAQIAAELGEVWERFEDEGQRRLRADRILISLGFGSKDPCPTDCASASNRSVVATTETPVTQLSGGWKAKLALASALFSDPQVLMLDEPTNHLDTGAIRWLEDFLVERYNPETKRTLLCVSHDRAFLNRVVTDLVVMHNQTLRFFHGDFDHFEEAAAQLQTRLEKAKEKNEAVQQMREKAIAAKQAHDARIEESCSYKIRAKRKYADGQACLYGGQMSRKVTVLREKNSRGGMERNLDGKAYKASRDGARLLSNEGGSDSGIEAVLAAAPLTVLKDPTMTLRLPSESLLDRGTEVAEISGLCFSYSKDCADKLVISDLTLPIGYGDKVALVGDNGSGKTTLLELLRGAGRLTRPSQQSSIDATDENWLRPIQGSVSKPADVKWSYVSQQESEALADGSVFATTTALQYLDQCFANWNTRHKEDVLIEALASFGIRGNTATKQPLPTLSSGQRVRVALARVAIEKPHLLILDEPTNHLDLYSVEALTRGLREFPGAVVFASHNRQMVLDVADTIVSLEAGQKPEVISNNGPAVKIGTGEQVTEYSSEANNEDEQIVLESSLCE